MQARKYNDRALLVSRYVRVISGCLAFWYYEDSDLFFAFYFISYFLDCLDGYAARYFNQATRFGQMLDMVLLDSDLMIVPCPSFHFVDRSPIDAVQLLCWLYWPICTRVQKPLGSSFSLPWILRLIIVTYILRSFSG